MNPGFPANSPIFSSPALGQLGVGPLSHGCAVPASRLPPRVLSASGRRPAPTDAAAETGRWATSHRDVAAPKGEPSLASPFGGRWCPVGTVQRLVSAAASVGDGRSPLGCITRVGRREGGGAPKVLKQSAALHQRKAGFPPARRAADRAANRTVPPNQKSTTICKSKSPQTVYKPSGILFTGFA